MPTEFCLTTEFNYDDYGVRLRSPIFLQKADYGLTTDLFLPVIFYYTLFLTPPLECSTQSRKRDRRGMPPGFVNGEPHLEPLPPPRAGDVELAAAGDKAAKMRMAKWRKRDMIRKRTIAQQQGRIEARMKSPARAPSPPLDDDIDLFSGDDDDVWCDDVGVMGGGAASAAVGGGGLTSSSPALRYVPVDCRPERADFC